MVGLVGYIGTVVLGFLLYPPANKNLVWGALGAAAVVLLMAILLLIRAIDSSQTVSFQGLGGTKISVGIGAILNILSAAAVTGGAVLKAREEKLL